MVWRYHFLKSLHQIGIRGDLGHLIQNYLSDRFLFVCIGSKTSSLLLVQNGVPQGYVLSVTLFLIAINDITSCIRPSMSIRLFVDDINICLESPSPTIAQPLLQQCIDSVNTWCLPHGFSLSQEKTYCMAFHRKNKPSPSPSLTLNSCPLSFKETSTFLRLTFDKKLTWLPNIQNRLFGISIRRSF